MALEDTQKLVVQVRVPKLELTTAHLIFAESVAVVRTKLLQRQLKLLVLIIKVAHFADDLFVAAELRPSSATPRCCFALNCIGN